MTTIGDILGPEAAAGDPDAVGRAAHTLSQLAEQSATTQARLRAAHAGRWTGAGAEAFAVRRDGPLPEQLTAIAHLCVAAEQSLTAYADRLGAIHAHARLLARQRDQAVDELKRRSAAAAGAAGRSAAARRSAAGSIEPVDRARAGAELAKAKASEARANLARAAAEERLRDLDARASNLREEHRAAADDCQHALDDATGRRAHGAGLSGWLASAAAGGLALVRWGTDIGGAATDAASNTITELSKRKDRLSQFYIRAQQFVRKSTGGQARGGVVEWARKHQRVFKLAGFAFSAKDALDEARRGDWAGAGWELAHGGLSLTPVGLIDLATGGIAGKEGVVEGLGSFWKDAATDGADAASDRCRRGEYGPALEFMTGGAEYMASFGLEGPDAALRRVESGEFGGALQAFAKAETAIIDGAWSAGESFANWIGGRP